jgi:hypothetical protein
VYPLFVGSGAMEKKCTMYFSIFFRASSWSMQALAAHWAFFVVSQDVIIKYQGRAVILGDHTYVPKDGRRMPGVLSLHQNSETQSKPSYFRGHCWGAIGVLIGSLTTFPQKMR